VGGAAGFAGGEECGRGKLVGRAVFKFQICASIAHRERGIEFNSGRREHFERVTSAGAASRAPTSEIPGAAVAGWMSKTIGVIRGRRGRRRYKDLGRPSTLRVNRRYFGNSLLRKFLVIRFLARI